MSLAEFGFTGGNSSKKPSKVNRKTSSKRKTKYSPSGPMPDAETLPVSVMDYVRHLHENSWKEAIGGEFAKPYFTELCNFLWQEKNQYTIYPAQCDTFKALNLCPISKTRVVILGQDPYIRPGQAHGLSFSVLFPVRPPPSLLNIFKELERSIKGFSRPPHGELTSWARQGVLLLNSSLTVRAGISNSHSGRGWEIFTDQIIATINEKCQNVVFLLWGSKSKAKSKFIDKMKHHILSSAHPSPLSAHRGFHGNDHFVKTNSYLSDRSLPTIYWPLPMTIHRPNGSSILLPPAKRKNPLNVPVRETNLELSTGSISENESNKSEKGNTNATPESNNDQKTSENLKLELETGSN